jgi:DNA-directed RNA polymerase subunit M/transcription elongation factor TFIIS
MESRKKNLELLLKIFDKKISERIEGGILGFAEEYSESQGTPFLLDNIYQEKFNEILCLIEANKNLVEAIKSESIKAETLAFMKAHELNPEKYEKINKKKELEEKNKKDKPTTDLFQCPKCKKRRCTVSEKQTRRGDEPATSFIDCLECGHSWRVG